MHSLCSFLHTLTLTQTFTNANGHKFKNLHFSLSNVNLHNVYIGRDHKLNCCWCAVFGVDRQPPLCATKFTTSRKNLKHVPFGHCTTISLAFFVCLRKCVSSLRFTLVPSTPSRVHDVKTTFPADIVVKLQITQFGYNSEMLNPHKVYCERCF